MLTVNPRTTTTKKITKKYNNRNKGIKWYTRKQLTQKALMQKQRNKKRHHMQKINRKMKEANSTLSVIT